MESVLPLVGVLFFVFLLARGLGEVTQRLGLPALIGEIVAGVAIANVAIGSFHLESWLSLDPTTAGGVVNRDALGALADVGVVFLVFAVGLEIRPDELRRFGRISAATAAGGIVIPFGLGAGFLLLLEGPTGWPAALFVGVSLVVTSLIVTARLLREARWLDTTEAHVILGAAVIEDIVGVILLTFALGVTAGSEHGPIDLVYQVLLVSAFAVVFVLFFLFLAPRLVRRYLDPSGPKKVSVRLRTRNATFVLVLLLCLGASALAASFQLASIVGAFFAGMALAEFRDQYDLRAAFESLNTFFVPFFFVVIGLAVSTGDLLAAWPLAAALTVLAVGGKFATVAYDAGALGRRPALRVAAGMVPRGEVGIIVALTAFGAGLISADLYTAIVVMAIATSVIGPYLLHRLFAGGVAPTTEAPVSPAPEGR
jgi:Kef-type K+ transport system membrane component KefB